MLISCVCMCVTECACECVRVCFSLLLKQFYLFFLRCHGSLYIKNNQFSTLLYFYSDVIVNHCRKTTVCFVHILLTSTSGINEVQKEYLCQLYTTNLLTEVK